MANESTKWLYEQLKGKGYNVGKDVNEFDSLMRSNADSRQWAYDTAKKSGLNVGKDIEEFSSLVGGASTSSPSLETPSVAAPAAEVKPASDNKGKVWKPTPMQKAFMIGSVQSSVDRFKAQADASLDRMKNTSEYYRRGGALSGNKPVKGDLRYDSDKGMIEQTYLTPTGTATPDKLAAERETRAYNDYVDNMTVSGQLRRAGRDLTDLHRKREARVKAIHDKWAEDQKKNTAPLAAVLGAQTYVPSIQSDPEYRALTAAIHQAEKRVQTLQHESDRQDGKDVGFWRGFGEVVGDLKTWDFGYSGLMDAMTMLDATLKPSPNRPAKTDAQKAADQTMLQQTYEAQQAEAEYGGNDSFWNRAGVMAGEMLPFMLDFYIAGPGNGASAVTRNIDAFLLRGLHKAAPKVARNKSVQWTTKVLGAMPEDLLYRAPLMANTVQGMKTSADIIDRKLGDVVVREDGTYDFSNDKTWGSAVWQGEANAIIENYSEMFGTHLEGAMLLKSIGKIAGTFGAKRLSGILTKASNSELAGIAGTMQKHLNQLGVSDYFGEVGEEYYGQLWRTMLNLDDAYRQNPDGSRTNLFLDGQFHGDIWGGMTLSIGLIGAGKYTVSAAAYGSMKHRVNKTDTRASEIFTPEVWEGWRERIDGTTNDKIGEMADAIVADPKLTDEQRAAAMNYMEASLNLRGFNLASVARQRGSDVSEDEAAANESYMDGYSATTPQEMNDAKKMLDLQRQRLVSALSEDVAQNFDNDPIGMLSAIQEPELRRIGADYVNARMVYDGMIQRVRDDVDGRIAQSNAMIDSRVNRDTGMIHPATMKIDDRKVYIVNGTVSMYEDGTGVDAQNSSESIIIRDAETGKVEFADPTQFLSVDETIDAETEKEAARKQIIDEVAIPAANNIEGVLSFTPGDTYSVLDGEGNLQSVSVLGQTADETGMPIDGYIDIQHPDGSIESIATQYLQQLVDAAGAQRVAQFDNERQTQRAADEEARRQADQSGLSNPNRRIDLMPDDYAMPYDNRPVRAARYIEGNNGIGGTLYQDEQGNDAVVIAAIDDNNYVGYFREYDEQGIPTNRWSAKFQNGSGLKENHRDMMLTAQDLLPAGHELTEHTSVSTDGLRNLANQLKHGYELQYDEAGNVVTTEVAVNQMARDNDLGIRNYDAGNESNAHVEQDEYKDVASKLIPYLEALGLNKHNIHWENGTLYVDHPVLRRADTPQQQTQPTVPNSAESVPNSEENAVLTPQNTPEAVSTDEGIIPVASEINSGEDGVIDMPSPEAEEVEAMLAHEEPKPSALSRIPKDQSGELLYEQTEPDTAWDALVEQTEGDEDIAKSVIEQTISEKEDELKKLSKQKPKAGLSTSQKIQAEKDKKKAMAGIQQSIDHWKRMAGTRQRRQAEEDAIRNAEIRKRAEEARISSEQEREAREEAERIEREALNGIPDWSRDTPQDARARGYRRNGPKKVDRQDNVAAVQGKEVEVKFGENELPKGHAAIIDATTLQPSHIQGSRNPAHFLDEAQPKERDDAASVHSAQKIAGNIRSEEITSSVTAYTGAPTINLRGETIQGNSRSDALRLMYESYPEQAAKYKQYLIDHARDFGLTPEQISSVERPVLVNMLDVADNEAIRLGQFVAQDTESGGIERIKPKNAVQKMGDKIRNFANILLRSEDDEASLSQLIESNGTETLKWMSRNGFITDTQYGSAFDSKGELSAKASEDLKGILYQSIFTGGSTRLEEMFNRLPAKAQRAILATAFRDYDSPRSDRMIEELQQSIIAFYDLSSFEPFANASNIKEALAGVEAWERQYAMDDVTGESYLPSENFSNFALRLAAIYKGGSQKFIQQTFNDLFDAIQGTAQDTLFEEADKTPKSLSEAIRKVLGLEYQPIKQNDNGNNGSDSVDIDYPQSETRGSGSSRNAESGEREQDSQESTDSGAGTSQYRGRGGTDSAKGQTDLQPSEEITANLSEETNEYDKPFVLSKNGTTTFGVIDSESGLTAAPIRLSLGENRKGEDGKNHGYGLLHIEAGHGNQIREAGYSSVEGFVEEVAQNYIDIREGALIGEKQTYLLEASDEHNNTLFVQLSNDGTYWNVNSAGIFKKKYSRRKPKVYSVPAVGEDIDTDTYEVNSGLSEGATAPAGDSSQTSDDKVNTLSSKEQTNGENSSLGQRIAAASEVVNTNPTEAQKEAGNYKKGHVQVGSFDVTIEQPVGSVRRGTDANGKKWESTMHHTYGYIRGTEGVDGDHIDVYISSDVDGWNGRKAFVVDQYNTDGTFDEHKVMLGFNDRDEAFAAYLSNYEQGWEKGRRLECTEVNLEDFEKWIDSSKRKTKPFADYKSVKPIRYDSQGNPIDEDGNLIIEDVKSVTDITDADFTEPTRTVGLPTLPEIVQRVLFTNGKKVIIKKNIFERNALRHDELTPEVSRAILNEALYNPTLYGKNKPLSRPNNWIVINVHDGKGNNKLVVLEVNENKDNVEIVHWHEVDNRGLEKIKRQAEREDGQLLILPSESSEEAGALSGPTFNSPSDDKVNTLPGDKQTDEVKSSEPYSITPTTYTNKKGKTSDVHLVKFNRELTKEEKVALDSFVREPLSEGRKTSRGWYDRKQGGYMMRTEVAAKELAAMIGNDEAVADRQPLSLDDMRSTVNTETAAEAAVPGTKRKEEASTVADISEEKPEEKPKNPSGNKLVTDERYAELRERMRRKLGGQMNMGIDPEILAIGTEMAVYHIEKGSRKFAVYAKAMIADLGDAIRPYLKSFYNAVRDLPEADAAGLIADMDSYDDVSKVDIANFDKHTTDAMATAEAVVAEEEADKQRAEAEKKLKEQRKVRRNSDGSTTETIVENGTEIEVTKGDFIPGVSVREGKAEWTGPQTQQKKKKSGKPNQANDGGLFADAEIPSLVKLEERPEEELSGDSAAYQKREAQSVELANEIATVIEMRVEMLQLDKEAVKPLTMTEVKKMASKYDALTDISDTDLQEIVELAMTQLTRQRAHDTMFRGAEEQRIAYDFIVNAYRIQPSLNARDSERLIKQQYSTPTPFGFVMGQFLHAGGQEVRSALEPSAGNGALTITMAPSAVHVNDIDDTRLSNLRKLRFGMVTAQDALLPFSDRVDAVITNPPFGTVAERVYDDIFRISSLEGQMAINALDSMKDDGRAAIVIGGNTSYRINGSMNPKDAAFFGYLYSHYNVADVINISGKALYSRNGTGYDVRIILIDGRKTGEFKRTYPPVKDKARAEQVTTFDELYKRIQDDIQQIQQVGNKPADEQRETGAAADGAQSTHVRGRSDRTHERTGEQSGSASDAVGGSSRMDLQQPVGRDAGRKTARMDNGHRGDGAGTDDVPGRDRRESRYGESDKLLDNGRGRSGDDGRVESSTRSDGSGKRLAVAPGLGEEKVDYPAQSGNGFTLLSVVPAAQAQVLQRSLGEIGDVDQFLVEQLGYSSKDELFSRLAAEQIDSVALAIHQMNKGNAFIIGDMTGVGKGRQGAALIRYAVQQGKIPVYFTQKPTLFTDNYRDLSDIGSSGLRPFIIASDDKEHSAYIKDSKGNVVYKLPSKKERERVYSHILEHGKLPEEYDYVITTYSQIQNGNLDYKPTDSGWVSEAKKYGKGKSETSNDRAGQKRRDILARLAKGNIVILDESHSVGGDSGSGRYMQMLTSEAEGVTFMSATFAKRADNMPIYAQRTAIAEAGIKADELIDAIAKGGVTLQEIMSKQLVESGQMIRRERSFEGVTIDWLSVAEETDRRQREQFDEVADIFNAIRGFQNDFIKPIIDGMNESAAERGATVGITHGTKDMGVKNVPFASKMYNLVNQLLFALKVDAVADRVIENLRNGYKPVISFSNTMEGFLSAAPKGEPMDEIPNFSLTLMRALDGVMRFTEKDANENSEGGAITLGQLSAEGQETYNTIRRKIMNLSADLPISPMDAIRMKIEAAGYSVAEITGRKMLLNRTENGGYIVEPRQDMDANKSMRDFNSGKLDVLMINKSGSTGISLHASSKFEDQRQRVMVFAQFQSDINDEVQMRGRIDRSGQVTRGRYEYIMSTIPAEQRIQMMFKAKLKSLDANTTSSQKSKFNEMEIVDYLNKYGDEVVWEYMKEHPELEERLGDPLELLSDKNSDEGPKTSDNEDTSKKSGCAGKISRYLAFLSVEEQDDIFREITEAYRVKIQLLDDAGENDLEITTMPLRAETKKRSIWHQGENPGGGNAFADNTYVEEVEADVLKKPMKRAEIVEQQRKLLGDEYVDEDGTVYWDKYVRAKTTEIQSYYVAKADETIDKMTVSAEARIAKEREKAVKNAQRARAKGENNFTDGQIEQLADEVANEQREKERVKLEKRRMEIMAVYHRISQLASRLRAGQIYVVPQDLKQTTGDLFTTSFGTFVGFKFNKSYTLGSSTAIFATLDGRRKVELALSDRAIDSIITSTETAYRYMPDKIRAISMDNWDSNVPTKTRTKRYIITGNLLQALVDTEKGDRTRGNLISFSTIEGETRQGILMGENFKPTDLRNSTPLSGRLAQIRDGHAVASEDGDVHIEKSYDWRHRGDFELRVPKSKQRGGKYTMDPGLLKLVDGNNFVTKGNSMIAYIIPENLAKVVDKLSRAPFNVTVLEESKLKDTPMQSNDDGDDGVRYRLDEVSDRIEQLFEEAVAGNLKGKPISIGTLSENGRTFLEELSGLKMKPKVDFVLNPSDLAHIHNDHFGNNEKDKGRNIPLSIDDIRNMADVITHPDKIMYGKEPDGLQRNLFYFLKDTSDGAYNLLEIYGDRKGNLTAKTFYKTKKGAAQRVMDLEKSLLLTSETSLAHTLYDAKIPQIFELSTDDRVESLERDGRGAYADTEVSMENDPWSKAWGESIRTKRQQRQFAERERKRMRERAKSLADVLGVDIDVVDDASSLTGRKQRAKGWYDTKTGKITVVVGNHTSAADMEATVLHEAVAHHGLRRLLGEHFDEFLDKVYEAAENSIKEQIDLLASRNGWNRRVATEEYLAGLAERTDFDRAEERVGGWFDKIKRFFIDMLFKAGFKYVTPGSIGDNELRYILWRSYQNLAHPGRYRAFEWEAEDVAMQYQLRVGEYAHSTIDFAMAMESAKHDAKESELEVINNRFNEQLEQQATGSLPEGHVYHLGFPGDILSRTGIPNLPIELRASRLLAKATSFGHDFDLTDIKDLPVAIQHPIAVFEYGNKDKAQNLIVELSRDGKNFVVGLSIKPNVGGRILEINSVRNVFPKNNAEWLNWISQGKALYLNKEKIQTLMSQQQTILADVAYLDLDSIAKIVENFENPTIETTNNSILFRDGDFTPRDRRLAAQQYERMLSRGSWQFREATQDSMLGLKSLYESILGKGSRIEDVAGYENAYQYENRMSSANNGEQHQYFIRFMKPVLESIHKLCRSKELDRRILADYMMAKHGLERNEYMRNEAASNGEETERDFAGLCGLTGESDWQTAETAAQQMVDDYETDHDTSELWDNVKKATNATLEKIYLSGLISEETYNKVLGMYDYYIPLRGWDETTSDEVYGYLTSKDGPLMGSVFKSAEGRKSKADDPIATIAMMADDAIRQGNRNIMKQRFLNFVHGNPSDLVSVNEMWLQYNDVTDEWEPVFADLQPDMTHAEVESEVAKFEAKMEALKQSEPDKYKKGSDTRNIPYKVVRGNLNEHQVLVKRSGRTYVMTINGNPRAAQALNGLTNPNVETGGVVGNMLKLGEYVNRHLSAFYTTRNPDFVVSNFFRDMLYSNCMTWVKENPRYALRFHKNFGKVNPAKLYGLLKKWEKGSLSDSNYLERMFKEFMLNGGETGYTSVKDIDGHKRTIAKELKKQGSAGRKAWNTLGMELDILNRSTENCARFAAFLTSREMGRTLDRSIYDAKEVSVNFNKKGSGGKFVNATGQKLLGKLGSYLGGGGRIAFVFWNASVQGMVNFGRAGKRHPAKAIGGAAALFTLGYVIPLLAQMLGGGDGDDDDKNAYYNLPEYVRRSNICFKAGEQWITIPLPIEYRAIYGMGELACGVISGNERYSDSELIMQMAAQVSQIMPLDMLEGGGGISPFIPSAFKPMTEAYILNRSWTGLPVYKDTPYNENDPEWTKAYQSADQHIVDFTRWLNETSGGDDFKKGSIDINPAKIEYLLSGTFGGVVSTTEKMKKMGETLLGDREFEWRNILLANRVIKSGDERTANRKLRNEYFKYLDEYKETDRLFKKYEKAADGGILGYAEKADFLYNSEEYLRLEIFEEFKSDIDAIRDNIKNETDHQKKKELESEYYGTLRELVDKLHKTETPEGRKELEDEIKNAS